jgi:ABC-type branched-subunit amino acid transport system substrate-binding protein
MFSRRIRTGSLALSLLLLFSLLLTACGGETPQPAATPGATTGQEAAPTTGGGDQTPTAGTDTGATATTPADTEATTTAPAGESGGGGTLTVGFAFVTSGDNAVYGNSQRAAAELAIEEINAKGEGPQIKAIFEDTAA